MAKIKGAHTAMKSGILAAESTFKALRAGMSAGIELRDYEQNIKESWIYNELKVCDLKHAVRLYYSL